MGEPAYESFEEFWPDYVRAHRKVGTRLLHFVGTSAAIGCVAGAVVLKKPWLLLGAPVFGYGAAWVGHLVIEGNMPKTFEHPLWSLRGDFKMWALMIQRKMQAEIERIDAADAGHSKSEPDPESAVVN